MEEKVQVEVMPDADTSPQSQEEAVLEQAVEKGEVSQEFGLQDDGVYKINLDEPLKTEEDAVQERKTEEVSVDEPSGDSKEVDSEVRVEPNKEEAKEEQQEEEVADVPDSPLELIKEEKVEKEQNQPEVTQEKTEETKEKVLPENIDKLVQFMEETGGTVEDYVSLNRDVSKMDNVTLLREYYKNTKPHLDADDVEFLLNKNFAYDGEADDPQEIKAKQLAFKEELFNAQNHFNSSKDKYYADLKLRKQNDMSPEQIEAIKHYDNYKQQKTISETKTKEFRQQTDQVFNENFKGFDFKVGENKYRFKVDNPQKVKEYQYSINNFIDEHIGKDGNFKDVKGYHKAMFAAKNADRIAGHFYEQGRADAIRESAKKAKNINMDPRKDNASMPKNNTSGIRVVSSSNDNPNKLRIKWNK
jgi:hypothetical protein